MLAGLTITTQPGEVHLGIDDPTDERSAQLQAPTAFAAVSAQRPQRLSPAKARQLGHDIERMIKDIGYRKAYQPLAPFKVFRVGTGIAIKSVLDRKRLVPKGGRQRLGVKLCPVSGQVEEYMVADQLGGMLNIWPEKWRGIIEAEGLRLVRDA